MTEQLRLDKPTTPEKEVGKLNTDEVRRRLRGKFCAPEYGFLEEVRNGTGSTRAVSRSADALVMSLWPSRGLTLSGIEIKVSRYDWLKELKNPAKAEEIAQYCDYWWIAVGDKDIVKDGELPPNWGLIVPRGATMVEWKQAARLEPKQIDRALLAAIFRRSAESSASALEIAAAVQEAEKRHAEAIEKFKKDYLASRGGNLERLQSMVTQFEEAAGIKLNLYQGGNIGRAVKLILESRVTDLPWHLNGAAKGFRELADSIDKAMAEYARPEAETNG